MPCLHVACCLVIAVALGCGKKREPVPEAVPAGVDAAVVARAAPPDAAPDAPPVEPWGPAGSCKLKMTGGETIDQPEGQASGVISWWFTAADRPADQVPDTFLINCSGPKFQLSIGSRPHGGVMAPRKYTDDKTHDELEIQAAIGSDRLVEAVGTLDVTSFDNHRFTATVAVTARLDPSNKKVKIVGTIDYVCPGFTGCVQ